MGTPNVIHTSSAKTFVSIVLSSFLFSLFSFGSAQQPLALPQALDLAFTRGPEMRIARANLEQAEANLKAQEADPSSPEDLLVKTRNAARLAQARLEQTRLETIKNVLEVYLGLYQTRRSLEVLETQVAFNARNLEVARSRQANRVGTPLEVARAENTLAGSRQLLANTRSQLPVLTGRLETLLGLGAGLNPNVMPPPAFTERPLDLRTLEQGLFDRLPGVVELHNGLIEAELAVRLTDNNYTPALSAREARTARDNARLALSAARQTALSGLADAFRETLDAQQQVQIKARDFANAEEGHRQNQVRFNAGTLSGLQLQGLELELRGARLNLLQAQLAYIRSLAALSVAAGTDVTGLAASR